MNKDLLSEVENLLRAGQYADAENRLRKIIRAFPDDWRAKMLFGISCLFQGNTETAAQIHKDAEKYYASAVNISSAEKNFWQKYHAIFTDEFFFAEEDSEKISHLKNILSPSPDSLAKAVPEAEHQMVTADTVPKRLDDEEVLPKYGGPLLEDEVPQKNKKRWQLWKFSWFRCIMYVIIFVACGFIFMNKLLFPAPHTGKRVGNTVLSSGKAELDALWLPGSPEKPVILFSHGNGDHLAWMIPFAEVFAARKYSILMYDYAGYGGSTGSADEQQSYSDIEAAYRFLTVQKKIASSRIIVIGYSVGSGPSCYLVSKYPVKALVLAAPFASAIQVLLPFSLPGDRFPNAERLKKCNVPLLLFHGKKDWTIRVGNGQKVFEAAAGKKKMVLDENARHNDLFFCLGERFWSELKLLSEQKTENDKRNQ